MEKQTTLLKFTEAKSIIDEFLGKAKTATQIREAQFDKYERFILDGEQWDDSDAPEGNNPKLSFNQSEDFVVTYLSKLFPRNPETGVMEVGVKSYEKDAGKKEQYEKEILSVYEENKLPQTLIEQGQNFLVGGDACLYYPKDPVTGSAKIISLDPRTVYLNWNGSKLIQFAFEDEISLADTNIGKENTWLKGAILKVVNLMTGETENTKKFKTVKRLTYWDQEFQMIKIGDDDIEIKKNEDGFIPLSWIPNNKKAHRHEGRSDGKMIKHLEEEFNKRMSNFGKRVKSNTDATLAAFTDMETKDIDRDDLDGNGVMKFGKDDKADFLKLPENAEVLKYTGEIAQRMATKFGINEAVQGAVKSNVSSLAMMYYFSPLLDRIGLKRIFWDEAFRELNRAILTYKFSTNKYRTDPVFQPVMQVDTSEKIKNVVMMLENRLVSHVDAIDMLRGSENAIEKFKAIQTEFDELAKKDGFLKNQQPKQETITL